jgi:4-amino-4-deoxy-L-arabinose transferase-like glycosyltransferase
MPPRIASILGVVLAAAAYLYHLDSRHIPSIDDEPRYIQIARVTGASGAWLPLQGERGLDVTKPPLLFWQGIASTNRGRAWTLWRLRLPIVLYTALAALLAAMLAARLGASRADGLLAALIFLGSASTVQHGRPFLTNAPETFFLFAPLVLLVGREFRWGTALLAGACLGAATLYKSFFLVVPVTAAVSLILARRRQWCPGPFLRLDAPRIAAMAFLGLAIFSLWLAVDPNPDVILRQFILGENLGKFTRGSYLAGLFGGKYTVWRIWLGDFANLGVYAFALAGLVWLAARGAMGRADPSELSDGEREVWLYVLAFIAVYTIPSQRQENYILPTVPALAVLLALAWHRIPGWLHRTATAVALLLVALLLRLMVAVEHTIPGPTYQVWQFIAVAACLALGIAAVTSTRRSRDLLPHFVLGAIFCLSIALSAFDRGFAPEPGGPGLGALAARTIWFPVNFRDRQEQFRFLLPKSDVKAYYSRTPGKGLELVEEGELTALALDLDAPQPAGTVAYASMFNLRTRLPAADIMRVVVGGHLDPLVDRLVILERPTDVPGGQSQ